MKLEKINDNQFRCILSASDLENRDLHLSELTYGSPKAKSLFDDMIGEANRQFGFVPNDAPLMVEAIPTEKGTIILTITKVDDPAELDTRFSQFASQAAEGSSDEENASLSGAENIKNFIEKMAGAATSKPDSSRKLDTLENPNVRVFLFTSLKNVVKAAKTVSSSYEGRSTLYLDEDTDELFLAVTKSQLSKEDFMRLSNVLTEYGLPVNSHPASLAYLNEHARVLISRDALKVLTTF